MRAQSSDGVGERESVSQPNCMTQHSGPAQRGATTRNGHSFTTPGRCRSVIQRQRKALEQEMPGAAHPDAKRRRDGLHGLIVIAATVILSFLTAELAVRCLGTDPQRWDLRNFAAYPLSPQQRWSFLQPDGRLGWVPRGGYSGPDFGGLHLTFDLQSLRAHRTAPARGLDQRPLLAVGNSYTMGAEVADDETYPAHLESELGRVVHNGGVLGY